MAGWGPAATRARGPAEPGTRECFVLVAAGAHLASLLAACCLLRRGMATAWALRPWAVARDVRGAGVPPGGCRRRRGSLCWEAASCKSVCSEFAKQARGRHRLPPGIDRAAGPRSGERAAAGGGAHSALSLCGVASARCCGICAKVPTYRHTDAPTYQRAEMRLFVCTSAHAVGRRVAAVMGSSAQRAPVIGSRQMHARRAWHTARFQASPLFLAPAAASPHDWPPPNLLSQHGPAPTTSLAARLQRTTLAPLVSASLVLASTVRGRLAREQSVLGETARERAPRATSRYGPRASRRASAWRSPPPPAACGLPRAARRCSHRYVSSAS